MCETSFFFSPESLDGPVTTFVSMLSYHGSVSTVTAIIGPDAGVPTTHGDKSLIFFHIGHSTQEVRLVLLSYHFLAVCIEGVIVHR